jgi:hypothetical protein
MVPLPSGWLSSGRGRNSTTEDTMNRMNNYGGRQRSLRVPAAVSLQRFKSDA